MSGNGRDDRPEPFAPLLDLINEHGFFDVIICLGEIAQLRAKDEDHYDGPCRALCARWHLELESAASTNGGLYRSIG
ncbi:MAG: hypothetical protein JO151_16150 [Verrucomicrobia bacterium]|nr:hypothetical protein [Verrucomicrobiota bacterium]